MNREGSHYQLYGDHPAVKQVYYPREHPTSVGPFLHRVSYALLISGDGFNARKYFGKAASREKESEKSVVGDDS